jgi:outer membrane protein insertion porin family
VKRVTSVGAQAWKGACLLALLLVVTLGPSSAAWAQVQGPDVVEDASEAARGQTILEIDVVGNRRVSRQDILAYLKEKPGQAFSPEALAQDVRELWGSRFFNEIEVDLDRSSNGVSLRFIVRELPTVRAIEFEGNDEIDDDDLLEAIEVKVDSVQSEAAIARSIQTIRDKYAEKGYFLAEADYTLKSEKNNEVTLTFKVTEHEEVTVRRVTFIGNENVTDDELRSIMFTGSSSILSFGSGGPFRQDAFERDIAVINAMYYDKGYLTVQIHTPRVMLTPDRTGMEVSVTIDEGPRFKIRQLRLFDRDEQGREQEPLIDRAELQRLIRATSGDYFNRAELLEDLGAVRTLYRDHGYANVNANPQTKIITETNEVDVIVPIERGPLVTFDRIEIRGNTKTRDKVIRREFEILEGQTFSETLLERSRRRATALGYFERVDVSTSAGSGPNRVNVEVDVIEKPTGTFQVGAGYSSIESVIATAQIQQSNLMGNGHDVGINVQWSGIRRLATLSFFEPYFLDSNFNFSFSLYNQFRQYQDFQQGTVGGSLAWGYPLIQPELVASLTYTLEDNTINTGTSSSVLGTAIPQTDFRRLPLYNLYNNGVTSSFRPALTFDTRDNRILPTSGIYLRASTELSLPEFGATTQFWQNRFTGRFYYPLGYNIVLKLNTEFGLITSPSADGVPVYLRYFIGGILDLRGFRFRDVGPRIPLRSTLDDNSLPTQYGARLGGNMMFYDNLELEFPLFQEVGLRGVIFTDAGNAWNLEGKYCALATGTEFDVTRPCAPSFIQAISSLRASYGFGVRWQSPMGPLRFEVGFPFSPLPYEESSQAQFTIGNFF